MIDWRIYYGSGHTFDNDDGPPELAPTGNVIAVAFFDEDNRRKLCHQADYYIWRDGRWFSADAPGFWQYMMEPGFKIAKFGREIGDLAYRNVMAQAMNDLPLDRATK